MNSARKPNPLTAQQQKRRCYNAKRINLLPHSSKHQRTSGRIMGTQKTLSLAGMNSSRGRTRRTCVREVDYYNARVGPGEFPNIDVGSEEIRQQLFDTMKPGHASKQINWRINELDEVVTDDEGKDTNQPGSKDKWYEDVSDIFSEAPILSRGNYSWL